MVYLSLLTGTISILEKMFGSQALEKFFVLKYFCSHNFHFKDRIPKDLTLGVVYKFQCGFCNDSHYGECVKHLNVRIGEHISISPLAKKQVNPKNSSVANHLLFCIHSASCGDFRLLFLTHDSKKFFAGIEREPVNNER